ncbi:glycosyltransferase [Kutzneria sp. CA-103260]|uniref:glycosyltransferase n=1 Tax=Kutzneria sp. CA-103260 TaxID=2802641 RepID=UPI00201258CD|nr:glycosyltransferase [Kutzneria sp. CA-103260]
MTEALAALGHEVVVHAHDEVDGDLVDRLRAAWRNEPPEVVHAHSWLSGMATALAVGDRPIAKVLSVPTTTNVDPDVQRLERLVWRRVHRVLAAGSTQVRRIAALGVPRSQITVVPHGVDHQLFAPCGARPRKGARYRLLGVGDVVTHHRFDLPISVLAAFGDTEFVLAGGPIEDNPEADRLIRCARHYGVEDRMHLLGPVDDMPALYRSADIVVCTPARSTFGTIALEAMASGVPVIAAAVGGLSDTVVNEVTGLLVPPLRPAELARAVRHLLVDSALREAFGAAGRDRACARYSWERVAADTSRAYARAACGAAPALQRSCP